MFGRATIRLGIGPHSGFCLFLYPVSTDTLRSNRNYVTERCFMFYVPWQFVLCLWLYCMHFSVYSDLSLSHEPCLVDTADTLDTFWSFVFKMLVYLIVKQMIRRILMVPSYRCQCYKP